MTYRLSDWSHVRVGESAKVFMGSGWVKGIVKAKQPGHTTIQVDKKLLTCYDPRNIKPISV